MELKNFPRYESKKFYSCGQACIKVIINFLTGKRVAENTLIEQGHEAEKHLKSKEVKGERKKIHEGLDLTGVFALARNYGLSGISMRGAGIDKIKFFLNRGLPVMIAWVYPTHPSKTDFDSICTVENGKSVWYNSHYSVVIGYDEGKKRIKVQDPEDPKKLVYSVSYKRFEYLRDLNPYVYKWIAAFWKKGETPDLGNMKGKRF